MYKADYPSIIKKENDYFNLYSKVKGITNFLETIHTKDILKHNNLVALYGEWGSGKSSVVKTVNNNLNIDKFNSFIFEAWKYEKDDNLPFSIFEAILDNIVKEKDAINLVIKEGFYQALNNFANGITLKTQFVDVSLKDMKPSDIKKSLYTKTSNFIDEFNTLLNKYSKDKTIVIFIDDLDRCDDKNIINLLMALKLMFSLQNIIFVCCIDKVAIIESLKEKYNGNTIKAERFLDKLFLFDFNLIPVNSYAFKNYLENENINIDNKLFILVLQNLNLNNPRTVKKIINKIKMIEIFNVDNNFNLFEKKLFNLCLYYILGLKETNFNDYKKFIESIVSTTLKSKKNNDDKNNSKEEYVLGSQTYQSSYAVENQAIVGNVLRKILKMFKELNIDDLKIKNDQEKERIISGFPINLAIKLIKLYS